MIFNYFDGFQSPEGRVASGLQKCSDSLQRKVTFVFQFHAISCLPRASKCNFSLIFRKTNELSGMTFSNFDGIMSPDSRCADASVN